MSLIEYKNASNFSILKYHSCSISYPELLEVDADIYAWTRINLVEHVYLAEIENIFTGNKSENQQHKHLIISWWTWYLTYYILSKPRRNSLNFYNLSRQKEVCLSLKGSAIKS